jgi:hypothetical protein
MALAGVVLPARAQGAQHGQADQDKDHKKQKQAKQGQAQQEQKKAKEEQRQQQQEVQKDQAQFRSLKRLPEASQRLLIEQQRQRSERYNAGLVQEERAAQQRANLLQTQKRSAQFQYQQRYLEGLRQQQRETTGWQSYDYGQDPYFYSAPTYRYSYAGRWYDTNQYGVDSLRQAVNNGYEEGFYAGRADRSDRWTQSGYRDSYGYQDANYGYNGRYIDQPQYNYYFREGFQRGYDDSFNSRYQYGRSADGRQSLLASVMATIVNFRSIQ